MSKENLQTPLNRLRFIYDVYECIGIWLRIKYDFFRIGSRGQSFEQFKTLATNSRYTYKLQKRTTYYTIQLRYSRTDNVSATNKDKNRGNSWN